jgi:glycosyltransferase involved in cell wall biosynthesis
MNPEGLPPVTYLSFDPVSEGVGASQVLPYVQGLAKRGVDVTLHSFERSPADAVGDALGRAGAHWVPHTFGGAGGLAGAARVVRGAVDIRGAELLHARAHLSGAAAVLARVRRWVWDVRSFWTEQRIDLGTLGRGSAAERTLRVVERQAARSSTAIIALAAAAIPLLEERAGCTLAPKARVISTCVDLERFTLRPFPDIDPVRLLMSGSLNALYDVPAMLRFSHAMAGLRPTVLEWVGPGESPWSAMLAGAGVVPHHCLFADMPAEVAAAHAGLCFLGGSRPSRAGAMPTKVAEFLACGRPVVVNAGIGDLDGLLEAHRCGVVIDEGMSEEGLVRGARELCALLQDPETPGRARRLAQEHFDLETGIDALIAVYASATIGDC